MYEIYEGKTEQHRKKTYLVARAGISYADMCNAAKRFYRCSEAHVEIINGWVLNDELYLENPHKKGTKMQTVAFWVA